MGHRARCMVGGGGPLEGFRTIFVLLLEIFSFVFAAPRRSLHLGIALGGNIFFERRLVAPLEKGGKEGGRVFGVMLNPSA